MVHSSLSNNRWYIFYIMFPEIADEDMDYYYDFHGEHKSNYGLFFKTRFNRLDDDDFPLPLWLQLV